MVRLAALVQKLAGMGRIVFIVTHDYEFVCRSCTRVLQLEGGRIRSDLPVTQENTSEIRDVFEVR